MTAERIFLLDPATYKAHPLHGSEREWPESNCYIDVWIEAIHALGLDAYAMLPFTVRSRFEDDQWTFYKPPFGDLEELYGLDVQELMLWRSLAEHCTEQTANGKLVFVEMDSFFLPDTKGTDYKTNHTKTTIVVTRIDVSRRWLGYLHNRSYHELEGDDFDGLFRTEERPAGDLLPYAELVRLDRVIDYPARELVEKSLQIAARHLALAPKENPLHAWADRFPKDHDWLMELDFKAGQNEQMCHNYVFAGARMCGSSFELAAHYVRWLGRNGHSDLAPAADSFTAISTGCKALVLKLVRIASRSKPRDLASDIRALADSWDEGMDVLQRQIG